MRMTLHERPHVFGAIVLVPFPFTSLTRSKQRPAVVISRERYNRAKPDIVVMAVTSQIRPVLGLGEIIVSDWIGAGLIKPSVVKPVSRPSNKRS